MYASSEMKHNPTFAEIFNQVAYGKSENTVFNDYLDIVICCLSGERYEEEYLSIVGRYKTDEVDLFTQMFATMVLDMGGSSEGFNDTLGEFYQLNMSRAKHGQFFTPEHVCAMMAEMIVGSESGKNVLDPCCGSGRMLLAAGRTNRRNFFYGADVDNTCCKMAAVNLCLWGLTGEIAHMNSITGEHYGAYRIFFDENRHYLPTIEKLPACTGVLYNNPPSNHKPGILVSMGQTKLDL